MAVPPRPKIKFDDDTPAPPATSAPVAAPVPTAVPRPASTRHATREGKRGVQVWLSPAAYRQLRVIAAREDLQIQDCMAEALDLFFQSRGEHRIARS